MEESEEEMIQLLQCTRQALHSLPGLTHLILASSVPTVVCQWRKGCFEPGKTEGNENSYNSLAEK